MKISQMLKHAQQLQQKFIDSHEANEKLHYSGEAGGGLVKVTVNGKGRLVTIKIDPKLANPQEVSILEELIINACKEASTKVEENQKNALSDLMGVINLFPNIKSPF